MDPSHDMASLRRLVAATLPRRVEIGDQAYSVRPPTVREALAVCVLLPEAAAGDPDDAATLKRLIEGWLPGVLARRLTRMSWRTRAGLLKDLLRVDAPETPDAAPTDDVVAYVRSRDWTQLLAEYRAVYAASLRDVLDEPWPLFMLQAALLDRVRSVDAVSQLSWYAAAKSGEADALFRAAGIEKRTLWQEPPHQTPEWYAAQRARAREVAKTLWQRRNPEGEA